MKNVCIRNAAPLVLAALFLSLCMILFSSPAFAEEPRGSADMDNEALLMAYIEQRLSAQLPAKPAPDDGLPRAWAAKSPARERLSQRDQRYYDALKPQIAQVAAGERASTEFFVSYAQAGIKASWTAAELGIDALIVYNGQTGSYELNPEVWDKISAQIDPDFRRLMDALLADCPYELYWFNKIGNVELSPHSLRLAEEGGEEAVCLEEDGICFSFPPVAEYAGEEAFTVNIDYGARISAAVENAAKIVRECAAFDDYSKLNAYKDRICALASYNHAAAAGSVYEFFGNPWQLIWVFDGAPDTTVVCEGYAKAFQYLCDMSSFQGPVSAYTVSGTMGSDSNSEAHMWNIVSMEDGKSYLVDVTNCDEGMCGEPDGLFMRNYGYIENGGYDIFVPSGVFLYIYNDETRNTYDDALLSLSAEPYPGAITSGVYGDNIFWSLQGGTLTISGTGDMEDYCWLEEDGLWHMPCSPDVPPWLSVNYAGEDYDHYAIKTVIIEDGVTGIGGMAFFKCFALTDVTIPESVTRIGPLSFTHCHSLNHVTIPASVRFIDDTAFETSSLCGTREFVFLGDAPQLGPYAFLGSRVIAYYPADNPTWTEETKAAFGSDFKWIPDTQCEEESAYCGDNVTWSFADGVLTLTGSGATWDYRDRDPADYKLPPWHAVSDEIRRIVVGEGIEALGICLFTNLVYLEEVELPESLVCISDDAFTDTCSLKSITLPSYMTYLGGSVLTGSAISEIVIPEGVPDIHCGAFELCRNLKTVYLPASLREIHECAFEYTGLQTVFYNGSEEDWNKINIYDDNETLLRAEIHFMSTPELTLPANLLAVEEDAFAGGTFSCVRLPAGLQRVESRAFANCANLRSVYVLNPDTVISTYAFGEDRAFLQSLTLYGEAGSSAERWAGMIGCRFVALP